MKKDKDTFLAVLEHHRKIIFKVCNSYCQDTEDRKDLGQEIIFQLWKSFSNYDESYKISTWMYRVALNVAISFYRTTSKRNQKNITLEESFLLIAEENEQETVENLHLLKHFINQLDSLNRALMILYLEDYSYEEMATILDISVSNVGTKLNRIKQKLRHQFETFENQNHGIR